MYDLPHYIIRPNLDYAYKIFSPYRIKITGESCKEDAQYCVDDLNEILKLENVYTD